MKTNLPGLRDLLLTAFLCISTVLSPLEPALQAQDQGPVLCPLYAFGKNPYDPIWPREIGAIAQGVGGLYSTTPQGGTKGFGAIFKVTSDGQFKKIWDFDSTETGAAPKSGLVDGRDGYLYGTTYGGGKWGAGTIFRIPCGFAGGMSLSQRIACDGGKPEVIYNFRNGTPTGIAPPPCKTSPYCPYSPQQRADFSASYPMSAPVPGSDGNLYGVTTYSNNQGYGTFYRISPAGGDNNFHVFCIFQPTLSKDKDMAPYICDPTMFGASSLTVGTDGQTFYGTTMGSYGAVFQAAQGGGITKLHEFNLTDGTKPYSVMQASDGSLYGTTLGGGSIGSGVVYRIDPVTKTFVVLTDFKTLKLGGPSPGLNPISGLAEGRDGNLYGAAKYGGATGRGDLYRLAKDGSGFTVVGSFNQYVTGYMPVTTPMFVGGDMYGTTYEGGNKGGGVFYRLNIDQMEILGSAQDTHSNSIVQVRIDVRGHQGASDTTQTSDGIAVTVQCSDRPHMVQFIYREKIGLDGVNLGGSYSNPHTEYDLTLDPKNPVWDPDALAKPSPYYEDGHSARRDCNSLTIFDEPSFVPPIYLRGALETWRATVRDYAMCGGKVVAIINWVTEIKPKSDRTYTVDVQPGSDIPASFKALLTSKGYQLP